MSTNLARRSTSPIGAAARSSCRAVTSTDLTADHFVLDQIVGSDDSDDTLQGGTSDDTMTGGTGADTFVFAANHGADTITDFTDGDDTIDLSAFSDITDFDDISGKITQDGDRHRDRSQRTSAGGTITLEGLHVDRPHDRRLRLLARISARLAPSDRIEASEKARDDLVHGLMRLQVDRVPRPSGYARTFAPGNASAIGCARDRWGSARPPRRESPVPGRLRSRGGR